MALVRQMSSGVAVAVHRAMKPEERKDLVRRAGASWISATAQDALGKTVSQLEEEVCGSCVVGEVAEFVDDEECGPGIVAESSFEGACGLLSVEADDAEGLDADRQLAPRPAHT